MNVVKKRCLVLAGFLLLGTLTTGGCGAKEAKNGDTVRVHYTGRLANGTTFDTSEGKEPLQFTLGTNAVVVGFEEAVLGMKVGEMKTVTMPFDKAYGPHREDLVIVVMKSQLPEGLEPKVGQHLTMQQPGGNTIDVLVTEITEQTITIDANHSLAGKDLTFDIKLVEIK
ncbi:MAG: peptidylprolyl isomerase [Chloroflexota bacterium]